MIGTYLVLVPDAEPLLGLLHDLCKMGGAMRAVMTRALTNPQVYKSLTKGEKTINNIRHMTQSSASIPVYSISMI